MMLEQKLEKYIQSCGCEVYDIEIAKDFGVDILRIYITSKNGVTLDLCQEVSQLISPILDVQDPIANQYTLEVSSPGLERILKKPRHFAFSIGEEIRVKMIDKTTLEGRLIASDELGFVVQVQDDEKKIAYTEAKKVKTILRW